MDSCHLDSMSNGSNLEYVCCFVFSTYQPRYFTACLSNAVYNVGINVRLKRMYLRQK